MKKKRISITLVILIIGFIVALLCVPTNPYDTNTNHILKPPSRQFLLGTDDLGRDIFSRIISGLRTSIGLSLGVVITTALVSIATSLIAFSVPKFLKSIIVFFVDIVHIMPIIVVCLVVVASFGSGSYVLFIGQTVAFLPLIMRVSLKELQSVMHQEFAQTSQGIGMHPFFVALKHGMPFLIPKLCSQCISLTAIAVGIEGSLSYFGLGIPTPHPSLGILLQDSRKYITTQPLYFILVTAVFLLLLCSLSIANFVFFQKNIWIVGHAYAKKHYRKPLENNEKKTQ